MRIVLNIVALLLIGSSVYSQDLKVVHVPRGAMTDSKKIVDGVTTHNYTSGKKIPVNGDPYFNKKFLPGVLELYDESRSDTVPMRYNVATDMFEVFQKNDTLILNLPLKIKYIYYDNKVFIYDNELRDKPERKYNGYFQQLVDGKLSLYIKRNKDLTYDNFAPNYQGGSGTKEYYYVDKVSFVGKHMDKKGFLLNTKKSFLKNIEGHKSEIKDFIKQNDIRFKNEADLVKLVEYYNGLS